MTSSSNIKHVSLDFLGKRQVYRHAVFVPWPANQAISTLDGAKKVLSCIAATICTGLLDLSARLINSVVTSLINDVLLQEL